MTGIFMDQIFINIKNLRKKRGLKQGELAELVGYTANPMIAKVEKGEIDLPLSKIKKFAEVLGVSVSELMGFSESDFSTRVDKLPPEGVKYMTEQLNYAEYRFSENNDIDKT